MEKETRAFYLKSFLFLFLPALAGRILRIVYSFVISDVLYADTLLPPALQYLAFAADAVLFGCAFALIPLSAVLYNKRKIWVLFGLSVLSLGFFYLSGFLTDLILGSVSGREGDAALVTLFYFAFAFLYVLVCAILSFALVSGKNKEKRSFWTTMLSGLLYFLTQAVLVVSEILEFLDEVHYPNEAEIRSMIEEGVLTFLFSGVLVIGISGLVRLLFLKKDHAGKEDQGA